MEKWSGKVAVVTGASSGMGAAIAQAMLKHNITVVNLDFNGDETKSNGKNYFELKCDVSDMKAMKAAFKWIEDKFNFIHILVNNAGIIRKIDMVSYKEEETEIFNKIIDVNFKAVVQCSREGMRLMHKSKDYGIIINIASIAAHKITYPNPTNVYPATKYAVRALSEILRQELVMADNDKIRVTNLSPGCIKTNIFDNSGYPSYEEFSQNLGLKWIQPDSIANGVIYVLSTPTDVNVTQLTIKAVGEKN